MTKTTKSKKRARTTARVAKSGPKHKGFLPAKAVRAESKLATIVGLLKRPEGCTTSDALAATGWPTISFNQQASAAGLKLRKVKEGRITRYFAA